MKSLYKNIGLILIISMCILQTGCKSTDYKQALQNQESGNYSDAVTIFSNLGDYKDAPERMKECQNEVDYTEAKNLIENNDFSRAKDLLEKIGDYKDSVKLLEECQNEVDYSEANKLLEKQEYDSAKELLIKLGDFKDSTTLLTECQKELDYLNAIKMLENKDYKSANELFAKLNGFKDSANQKSTCEKMLKVIDEFNVACEALTQKNSEVDTLITKASELVKTTDKALDEDLRPAVETAVSDIKSKKVDVPSLPDTETEINEQTEKIKAIDYSEAISNLDNAFKALEHSIKQYKLVDHPSEAYVIGCLQRVYGITGISAATEDNDPNGNLGKAASYTAAVYFSHENVNQSEVYGDSLIDKGTAAGGQVEVYVTVADAEKRNAYLSGFDGTWLSNGSHKVIGTVVVRTSDELTASQQKSLEENIISELTNVEASESS